MSPPPQPRRAVLTAWAALLAGGSAWFVSQQIGSNLSFADCDANGALPTLLLGVLALALTGWGGWLSWRAWRGREAAGEGSAFVALVGTLAAGLIGFAIVLQTLAGLILPECIG